MRKGGRCEMSISSIFYSEQGCDVKLLQRTTPEIRVASGGRFGETM